MVRKSNDVLKKYMASTFKKRSNLKNRLGALIGTVNHFCGWLMMQGNHQVIYVMWNEKGITAQGSSDVQTPRSIPTVV